METPINPARMPAQATTPGGPEAADDAEWEKHFNDLIAFHQQSSNFRVHSNHWRYPGLLVWTLAQRAKMRRCELRPDRYERLAAIGFFERLPSPRLEEAWDTRFAELVEFQRRHGHLDVPPHGHAGLHDWIKTQRWTQRNGSLRPDRQQRLESIGFAWTNPRKWEDLAWDRNFTKLVMLQRRTGRYEASSRVGLHQWIRRQRILNRLGRLRPERRQRLQAIGFPWVKSDASAHWRLFQVSGFGVSAFQLLPI